MNKHWYIFFTMIVASAHTIVSAEKLWDATLQELYQHNEYTVIELLQKHPSLKSYILPTGLTLAHYVCMLNMNNVLAWLIKNDSTITATTHRKMTPLHMAINAFAKQQSPTGIETIDMLLQAYSEEMRCYGDEVGNTALHYVIDHSLLPLIYLFIPYKNSFSKKNNYGQTPLHRVIEAYKAHASVENEGLFKEIIIHTPQHHCLERSLKAEDPYQQSLKNRSGPFLKLKKHAETIIENIYKNAA